MSQWDAHIYDTSLKFVADYGKEVVELLNPQKGETILDLGCGTGDLTAEIADKGAHVIGLDRSDMMLERARAKHSNIQFVKGDILTLSHSELVDAVFANASLHWVTKPEQAVNNIFKALKPGGRLVAELGGKGNVAKIIDSIQSTILSAGFQTTEMSEVFYFPSIGEYATLLEKSGFRVEFCQLFERPTLILKGSEGFQDWIRVFGILLFKNVPFSKQNELLQKAAELMAERLERDERYFADYVRLRVVARKLA